MSLDVQLTQKIYDAGIRLLPKYRFQVAPAVLDAVVGHLARTDAELADTPPALLRQAYPAIAAQLTQAFSSNPEPPPFEERFRGLALGQYSSTQERPPAQTQVKLSLNDDGVGYINLVRSGFYVPDGKRVLEGQLKFHDFIDNQVKLIDLKNYGVVWNRYSVEQHGFIIEECSNGDALKVTAPANFTGTQRIQVASVLHKTKPGVIPLDIIVRKQ